MSLDFDTCLVLDDRLNVSDKIQYGVYKGAMENNVARYPANAVSSSSHTYNIQVPSRSSVVSRNVQWQATVTLTLQATGGNGAGQINTAYRGDNRNLVNVGAQDALGPFPLHNLMSSINATINSNTVSMNVQDVLPQLLRLNNKGDLLALNGTTPTSYDTFLNYSDSHSFVSSSLGGINNSPDENINERGSFPVILGTPNTVVPNTDGNPPVAGTVYEQTVTFTVQEPLLLSPFLFGDPSNKAGIFGVNNMSFQMQVGSLQRAWRHAPVVSSPNPNPAGDRSWNLSVSKVVFSDCALIFNFLTVPQSMQLPPRCAVPYYSMDRFILNNTNTPLLVAGTSDTLQSNAISLSSIPDKFIICVRKPLQGQTCQDTDSFLTINSVDMTFNNKAGYLSGWDAQRLYRVSRENGSNQSWPEFYGKANAAPTTIAGGINNVNTSGSLLVLELNKDIVLPEEYLSAGSGGQYTLQFQINVTNNYGVDIRPELVLIAMNSGAYVLEQQSGSSYLKIGMLTPDIVTSAKAKAPVVHADMKRMVGSGFMDSLRSAWKMASPLVKKGVELVDQHAGSGLSASGLSASGLSASGIHRAPKRRSLKDRLAH